MVVLYFSTNLFRCPLRLTSEFDGFPLDWQVPKPFPRRATASLKGNWVAAPTRNTCAPSAQRKISAASKEGRLPLLPPGETAGNQPEMVISAAENIDLSIKTVGFYCLTNQIWYCGVCMTNEAKNWGGFEASSIGNHVILQYQLFIIMLAGDEW